MTAPAINPAMNAPPGPTGVGNGQAAAGGALAGFEALMATLFGNADIAGVASAQTPAAAAAAAPAAGLFAPMEDKASDDAAATPADAADSNTEAGAGPDAEAALDPLLMAQAAPLPPPAPTAETTSPADGASPAWGQDKAKGAPAGPAVSHADPQAGLAETTEAGPNAVGAADAPPAQTPRAEIPAPDAAETRGAASAVPPPAPAATDAKVAAQAAAKAPVEAAPAETPAPTVLETAQAARASEITRTADAPPPPPAAPRRKDRNAEPVRSDPGSDSLAPKAEGARAAPTAAAAAAAAAGNGNTDAADKAPGFKPAEADTGPAEVHETAEASPALSEMRSTHASGAAAAPGAHAVRGAPETVANLAAQIVKKLDGRSTRFDVELDPIGLGRVDVRVEIGAHGKMTAAMSFENPQAAAELKSRSGDLQRALEQAGFDLSGGLSFDVAGDRGQARQEWAQDQGGGFRGRAFQQALETAGEADLAAAMGELRLRRGVTGGVDVRI